MKLFRYSSYSVETKCWCGICHSCFVFDDLFVVYSWEEDVVVGSDKIKIIRRFGCFGSQSLAYCYGNFLVLLLGTGWFLEFSLLVNYQQ